MYQIGDRVYVLETGDSNIDRFLNTPMEIVAIEPVEADRYTSFPLYTLCEVSRSLTLRTVSVLEHELEYRNG